MIVQIVPENLGTTTWLKTECMASNASSVGGWAMTSARRAVRSPSQVNQVRNAPTNLRDPMWLWVAVLLHAARGHSPKHV